MSVVSLIQNCPLCGTEQESCPDGTNYTHNLRSREQEFACGSPTCGFGFSSKIEVEDGREFWVETYRYPMDADGSPQRPPERQDY